MIPDMNDGILLPEIWNEIADILPITGQVNLRMTCKYIKNSMKKHIELKQLIQKQFELYIASLKISDPYDGYGISTELKYNAQGKLLLINDCPLALPYIEEKTQIKVYLNISLSHLYVNASKKRRSNQEINKVHEAVYYLALAIFKKAELILEKISEGVVLNGKVMLRGELGIYVLDNTLENENASTVFDGYCAMNFHRKNWKDNFYF